MSVQAKRMKFLELLATLPYDVMMQQASTFNGIKEGSPLKVISMSEFMQLVDNMKVVDIIFSTLHHFHTFLTIEVRTRIVKDLLTHLPTAEFEDLQLHDRILWIIAHTSIPLMKVYTMLYDGYFARFERPSQDDPIMRMIIKTQVDITGYLGISKQQLYHLYMILSLIKKVPNMSEEVAEQFTLIYSIKLESFYHVNPANVAAQYMNRQLAALRTFKEQNPEVTSHPLFIKMVRYTRYIANHWEDESIVVDVYANIYRLVLASESKFAFDKPNNLTDSIRGMVNALTPTQQCLMKHINASVRHGYYIHQVQLDSSVTKMYQHLSNTINNQETYQTWCGLMFHGTCPLSYEDLHITLKYDYLRWLIQRSIPEAENQRAYKKFIRYTVYNKEEYDRFREYTGVLEYILKPIVCDAVVTPFMAPLFRFEKANQLIVEERLLTKEEEKLDYNDIINTSYWYKTHFTHQAAAQLISAISSVASTFGVKKPLRLSGLWCQEAYKQYKFDKNCDNMAQCSAKLTKEENDYVMASQELCYAQRLLFKTHCEFKPDEGHDKQLEDIMIMIDNCKAILYNK